MRKIDENEIDENEVDLKEKPEDTRYIKKITSKWDPKHRECGQSTWFPTLSLSETTDLEMGRVVITWRVLGWGEIHSQAHHLPRDCWR